MDTFIIVAIVIVALALVALLAFELGRRIKGGETDLRPNLLIIFGGLIFAMLVVIGFALILLTPNVINGNEELIIGGVIGIVGSAVGSVALYGTGVMQALTAPPDPPSPAPTITETSFLKAAALIAGRDFEDEDNGGGA